MRATVSWSVAFKNSNFPLILFLLSDEDANTSKQFIMLQYELMAYLFMFNPEKPQFEED